MATLRSDLWCMAFVRRHNDLGNMCVIARRGDPIAGQVFIELDHLDGTRSLFTPAPVVSRGRGQGWCSSVGSVGWSRKKRDRIAQEAGFDPDLWVISVDLRGDDPGIELAKA
ncbi:DUF1491 family protein [Devosia aurantiaca]|uniref:DUF1491 family protein n=1 Tax=Devosia aurantiaca TaxID=2714858 RepID=A0A6M1SN71_9HYPH|nr:DUF1491 family protein [Devosia aurantiaca]NGP18668.1 DUF1491 family protein [Devosia aurantiaca]